MLVWTPEGESSRKSPEGIFTPAPGGGKNGGGEGEMKEEKTLTTSSWVASRRYKRNRLCTLGKVSCPVESLRSFADAVCRSPPPPSIREGRFPIR
jgi:hypothetical protein